MPGWRQRCRMREPVVLLTVGELAKRCGLTVRALHHFHQIGLLAPSVRSEAGYRLYDRDDVARLHAIQALRSLGVPLKQIGGLLAGDGSDLPAIVARQTRALDRQIAQATELRQRLAALGALFAAGHQPDIDDWLGTLALMNTYARYFSAEEIGRIVANRSRVGAQLTELAASLQAAKDAGLPPGDAQVQALTQRWMGLMHHWLDGDFDLMQRWGEMYAAEPRARGEGGPDLALIRYVEQAAEQRMALWLQHFSLQEISAFKPLPAAVTQALEASVQQALAAGALPTDTVARELRRRWQAKLTQATGGNEAVAQRLMQAYATEPAMRIGATLSDRSLAFLLAVPQDASESA
jgi:DNA-binding transcriptional MerR regulator